MWFPIFREPRWILRIDILQCIGVSLLVALPFLFLLAGRPRALSLWSLGLAALVFGLAPLGEHVGLPLGHFLNTASGSTFALLPWSGYVYLGAAVGAATAEGGAGAAARWLLGLAAAGLVLWWATPQLLALYPPHEFWVTNPANCARRWTLVCGLALLLLGAERLGGAWSRSLPVRFIEVFGTSSLAAYFLHESLLFYRVFGLSFHRFWADALSWPAYWGAVALLVALTFVLTWVVDKVYRRADALLGG